MSQGGYALLPTYAAAFDPASKNSSESVFKVQHQVGSDGYASNFIYGLLPPKPALPAGPRPSIAQSLPTATAYPFVQKYLHPHAQFSLTNNWPVYRYSEVQDS